MPSVGRPICSGHSSLDSLRKRQRPLRFQPCCTFAFEDLTHRASVMVRETTFLLDFCFTGEQLQGVVVEGFMQLQYLKDIKVQICFNIFIPELCVFTFMILCLMTLMYLLSCIQ